jgi:hypothetical protein
MASMSTSAPATDLANMIVRRIELGLETTTPDEQLIAAIVRECTEIPDLPDSPPDREPVIDSITIGGVRAFGPRQTIRLSRGLTILHASNGVGKTSICDALELHTRGTTTRSTQHPDAATETRDRTTVIHRDHRDQKPYKPEVTVAWRSVPAGNIDVRSVWSGEFGEPARDPAPIAVIPRRRLRDVLGVRQTDRMARLGEDVGIGELTATWHAAAKVLRVAGEELPSIDEDLVDLVDLAPTGVLWHLEPEARATSMLEQVLSAETSAVVRTSGFPAAALLSVPPFGGRPIAPDVQPALAALADIPTIAEVVPEDRWLPLLGEVVELLAAGDECPVCADGRLTPDRLDGIRTGLDAAAQAHEHQRLRRVASVVVSQLLDGLAPWSPPDEPTDWRGAVGAEREQWRRQLITVRERSDERSRLLAAIRGADVSRLEDTAELISDLNDLDANHRDIESAADELERLRAAIQADTLDARQRRTVDEHRRTSRARRLARYLAECGRAQERSAALCLAADELIKRLEDETDLRISQLAEPINAWLRRLRPSGTPEISVERQRTSGRPGVRFRLRTESAQAPDALARFSDSQLDMLGLAIQLARLDREAPGHAVLLDDPTDMLDVETLTQFAQVGVMHLLEGDEQTPGRQVVITTHCRDLVRKLWAATILHRPRTAQDFVEVVRDESDTYAVVTSRDAAEMHRATEQFRSAHWQADRGQMWFRSAFGNQVRRCVEMLASDLAVITDRDGNSAPTVPNGTAGELMSAMSARLHDRIESIHDCTNRRVHGPGVTLRRQLVAVLTTWNDHWLNPSSHADVVLPSVDTVQDLHVLIGRVTDALRGHEDQPRDAWHESCDLAAALRPCPLCAPSTRCGDEMLVDSAASSPLATIPAGSPPPLVPTDRTSPT